MTPSPAERCRTALADATVAVLATRSCTGRRTTATAVEVADGDDGTPLVWLDESSTAARTVARSRLVTLVLTGWAPFRSLDLTGALLPGSVERDGRRGFRLSVLSVRLVGVTCVAVPIADFRAAAPDPLRHQAPAVVEHLAAAHSAELLACVRAHDHREVTAVMPTGLDRWGIELTALDPDGIRTLRLDFPRGPVARLEDVELGLRVPLRCRCDQHAG